MSIKQGSAIFFCKGPEGKYFGLCDLESLSPLFRSDLVVLKQP